MFEDIEEVDVNLKNKWESKFCYDYVLNLIDYLMMDDLKWQALGSNDLLKVSISQTGSAFSKDLPLLNSTFIFPSTITYESIFETIN